MPVLRSHIKKVHVSGDLFCDQCDYKALKKNDLISHKYKIHNLPRPVVNYTCSKCDFRAEGIKALNKHVNEQHETTELRCNQCPFTTHKKGSLQYHINRNHTGRKDLSVQFVCFIPD